MAAAKRIFGLIGETLKHSFSKQYFTDKFIKEGIPDCSYQLFELANIQEIVSLIETQNPDGLNVTIPYKLEVIPYLTNLDDSAKKVGAVNVIKFTANGKSIGYNSDYYGFKASLLKWAPDKFTKALILGTGGASQAVKAVLKDLQMAITMVSRTAGDNVVSYRELEGKPDLLAESTLIVNTTPLGMHPNTNSFPALDYNLISSQHYLYDLVYNPEVTEFMKLGLHQQAKVKNGYEMLVLQAEKSWEIWNSN